jgi:immune inhibitor A
MNGGSVVSVIVVIFVVVLCCCLCVALILFGGLSYGLFTLENGGYNFSFGEPTTTPVVIRPTFVPTLQASNGVDQPEEPVEDSSVEQQPAPIIPLVSTETLDTLENTAVPINDLLDLARRLEGKTDIPRTLDPPAAYYQVGAQQIFWVTNVDTNLNFQVETTLCYVTEHTYFWIENGVSYDDVELQQLAETFENQIYPTDREFFGSEWTPGVDGDPHIYIIYASGLGKVLAGAFFTTDEYHPLAHEYSNGHETFVLNADNVKLDEPYTYGTLAHEFQHMIHWYQDRNETTWLNEGFSELAAFLNGYPVGGFDYLYAIDPDMQLNTWPSDPSQTSKHYGAAFLFVTYFLDRFGEQATQALVAEQQDGIPSIDTVLTNLGITDPLSGKPIGADDVFIDWALASYLLDADVGDGRYTYHNYPDAPRANETATISTCPAEMMTYDVSQYGADYFRITCRGDRHLHFEGSIQVGVVPGDVHSGDYAFWSNLGDDSDMTLTRSFDFSDVSGPLTLSYWTWYDLEKDYDYVYLEASTDGENWQILTTPSGTGEDPSGNSYGWSYNGLSGGDGVWILETVNLSEFAGQQIQIRFEYVTDAAVYGDGLMLDDIAIPEIDYFTDFEADSGGWEAAGFVRIQNVLPQNFRLALITKGVTTQVEYISLTVDNVAEIDFSIGSDVDQVILVVTGTTRFTCQRAAYRFEIE